ncbi:hypothetical protein TNCV_3521801 [Trichonephila clavipes]|nr:hypothetical protein TNCV_3521801 [Trichonephila clavipes]
MEIRGMWEMRLTNILPVVDCPEMSSPAQSFASVINPISFPPAIAPPPGTPPLPGSVALTTFAPAPAPLFSLFRQQRKANARQIRMMKSPAMNVNTLDRRKHHHLRSFMHSSWALRALVTFHSSTPVSVVSSMRLPRPSWIREPSGINRKKTSFD